MTTSSKPARWLRLFVVASMMACSGDWPAKGTSGERPGEAVATVASAISTTSVTFAGDELRTGWYSDEAALAPATVGGGSFGPLFTASISGQVYAQPLVSQGTLFIVTEDNFVYGLDPATGRQIWFRSLATAVSASDLPKQCSNISPTVGITGTPVIDTSTNIAYLLSKAYLSGSSGTFGYFAHGINVATGTEVAGFPVPIQGTATNDSTQTFNGQIELQRPALLLLNGVVYAGFGSHCDQSPAVGWVVGVSTSGQITTLWTTEAGSNRTALGSVWAPGALASDGSGEILVVTGNGVKSTVTTSPGTSPPAALPEAAVRLTVQTGGSLKATDYFSPFDTATLDTNDWDFGASSPLLLPSTFGTTAIPHLMMSGSKGGVLYLLNRDSLGGRGQGTIGTDGGAGGDAVLEEVGPFPPNALGAVGMWTKPGVWPGDGGYVYTVEASENGALAYLRAFTYGLDGSGKPTFTFSGRSSGTFGSGSGSPMVTSNGMTDGSALLWVEYTAGGSSSAELRAYDAVPVSGVMNERWHGTIGQMANFASPGIAGGRVYVGTRDGRVLGFGTGLISNLFVDDTTNAANWSIQSDLAVGAVQYGDRTFTLTTVPSTVAGSEWIRTANSSKAFPNTPIATFMVTGNADVYVAFNDLISPRPSWLSAFTDTGMNLVNSEAPPKTFSLLKESFATGSTVTLGNGGNATDSFYTVLVAPTPATGLIGNLVVDDATNAANWSIQSNLAVGVDQYGDRTFTLTTVPSTVAGSAWIRTANSSKAFPNTPIATFTVTGNADVYVAFNDLITPRPSWLSAFTDTGMNLVNSEAPPKTFSLLKESFATGSTVTLGNGGNTTDSFYTVVVAPTP